MSDDAPEKAAPQRYLIICGGTGGHLAPGIALAERLTARGHSCRLVVSRKEVDSRLRAKYTHLNFEPAPGAAFGLKPHVFIRFLGQFLGAFRFARRLMRDFEPQAVVAFGGFMSPPYILQAWRRRIFVALHESNRQPGRAIRVLARFADRIYLPVGVRLKGITPTRMTDGGYPIRKEIRHTKKVDARRRMQLEGHGKTLVVIGGSQGAMALNQWVGRHFKELAEEGVNIFAVTGPGKGAASVVEVQGSNGESARAEFMPFCDDMAMLLSVADLVVSRAGAGAIAEIIECLAPSVLVPYPYAADRHQEANAKFLEKQGACVVLPEERIDQLMAEVRDLLFNDALLNQIRANLRALNRVNAAEAMALELENTVASRMGGVS
jgi:UDP-N-acetylglucosamine--N-acetylmuramyl-(pentapeptide) pyrophosphoryl-undecaprenol N-acetylglucosamine transferase